MISKDFIWIVVAGMIVAAPIAWMAMDMWLSSCAYRIRLSAAMFLTGGALVMGLALITIWHQAAKAARANPASSLRNE